MAWNGETIQRMARRSFAILVLLAVGFALGIGASRLVNMHVTSSDAPTENVTEADMATPWSDQDYEYGVWDEAESPNYYRVLGPAVVGELPEAGASVYGELDELGRARGAISLVTHKSMMAGRSRERESLADVSPTGWGFNREVDITMPDGSTYHGQLFNRSHLLAKSLGGDDEAHNLITATRTQNVGANVNGFEGGMAYGEGLARTWLESHPEGSLYYAATPVYAGEELVARSVIVDIRSSDDTLDLRIEVYNAAKGFDIDYATGDFTIVAGHVDDITQATPNESDNPGKVEGPSEEDTSSEAERPSETEAPSDDEGRLVIVTGSGKAYHHDESCSGLAEARSMRWVTVAEATEMGRHPCGICGG